MVRNIILSLLFCLPLCSLQAQEFTLTGRVVDTNDSPIELASVSCLGQGKATMTDLKGHFSMSLRSADSVAVRFSMVGYKSKTRVLRRPRGKQTLKITLSPMDALNEIVVTEKRRQTTPMEKLDASKLKDSPSTSGNAEGGADTAAGGRKHTQRTVIAVQRARRQFRREFRIYK